MRGIVVHQAAQALDVAEPGGPYDRQMGHPAALVLEGKHHQQRRTPTPILTVVPLPATAHQQGEAGQVIVQDGSCAGLDANGRKAVAAIAIGG